MYVEDLFDKLSDEYESKAIKWEKYTEPEKLRIWEIWAKLFSRWLVCFPARFMIMNEGRMCLNGDKALKYLSNRQANIDTES